METEHVNAPAFVRCEALDERAAIAEYETAVAIPALEDEHLDCPICREEIVWANHVRLPCGHTFDGQCLRSWFVSRVRQDKTNATFACPMCRADCRVEFEHLRRGTTPPRGVPTALGRRRILVGFADWWGNWHVVLVVLVSRLGTEMYLTSEAMGLYETSQCVFHKPMGNDAYVVVGRRPRDNPSFRIVSRWTKSGTGRWLRESFFARGWVG